MTDEPEHRVHADLQLVSSPPDTIRATIASARCGLALDDNGRLRGHLFLDDGDGRSWAMIMSGEAMDAVLDFASWFEAQSLDELRAIGHRLAGNEL